MNNYQNVARRKKDCIYNSQVLLFLSLIRKGGDPAPRAKRSVNDSVPDPSAGPTCSRVGPSSRAGMSSRCADMDQSEGWTGPHLCHPRPAGEYASWPPHLQQQREAGLRLVCGPPLRNAEFTPAAGKFAVKGGEASNEKHDEHPQGLCVQRSAARAWTDGRSMFFYDYSRLRVPEYAHHSR
eukprot:1196365-Prorocentrum_minimum.AAC.9